VLLLAKVIGARKEVEYGWTPVGRLPLELQQVDWPSWATSGLLKTHADLMSSYIGTSKSKASVTHSRLKNAIAYKTAVLDDSSDDEESKPLVSLKERVSSGDNEKEKRSAKGRKTKSVRLDELKKKGEAANVTANRRATEEKEAKKTLKVITNEMSSTKEINNLKKENEKLQKQVKVYQLEIQTLKEQNQSLNEDILRLQVAKRVAEEALSKEKEAAKEREHAALLQAQVDKFLAVTRLQEERVCDLKRVILHPISFAGPLAN
jgi:hypothetical protein